jgi:hypothetical protein
MLVGQAAATIPFAEPVDEYSLTGGACIMKPQHDSDDESVEIFESQE